MAFKIVITETHAVKKLAGKEWDVIGTREIARDPSFYSGNIEGPKTRIEDVRGYTPEIEKTVTETREVLSQQVDDLDLISVIKAINRIP